MASITQFSKDANEYKLLSSNGIVYAFTIFFAKLSIMLLYLRIFNIDRGLRLPIYLGIVFQALFYSAMIGVANGSIAECNGPSQITNQYCKNYGKPVVVLNAAVNVATDIYILLLPIPRVLKLQLGRRHRLGLLLVFATGVVYVVILSLLPDQADVEPQDLRCEFDPFDCLLRPL